MAACGEGRWLLLLRPQSLGVAEMDGRAGPTGDLWGLAQRLDVEAAALPAVPRRQRIRQGQDLHLPETVNTFFDS